MVEQYIGIENELVSFRNGSRVSFGDRNYFHNLRDQFSGVVDKSGSSIRTDTGHGFYIDGDEIEILTPPIAINLGFSSRLTDMLMIGRNHVINSNPNLVHTGFSMHWNLSSLTKGNPEDSLEYMRGSTVPFNLFGLTPSSIGSAIRSKSGRYELLGDSIGSEDQINALALMLGSYNVAFNSGERFNFCTSSLDFPHLVDGRYHKIQDSTNDDLIIQGQQALELFYYWLEPTIKRLGSSKEVGNLEDFISGNKKLEFDNFRYHAAIRDGDKKAHGIYLPFSSDSDEKLNTVLTVNPSRNTPLEGKLLGGIISAGTSHEDRKVELGTLGWDGISYALVVDGVLFEASSVVRGIDGIYRFARELDDRLPELEYFDGSCKVRDIASFEFGSKIEYSIERDNSMRDRETKGLIRDSFDIFSAKIKERGTRLISDTLAVVGIGVGIAGLANTLVEKLETDMRVNEYVESQRLPEEGPTDLSIVLDKEDSESGGDVK